MVRRNTESLAARIEKVRTWIVIAFGLIVGAGSLAFVLWPTLAINSLEPEYLRLVALQAALGLASSFLAWRGWRRWGARLLSVTLLIVPTVLVLGLEMPFEPALAGFVGVLMITAAGSSRGEVLIFTAIVTTLGLLTYVADSPRATAPESLLSIGGLLLSTGITLSWLGDSLVRAIRQLEASAAHFHRLSHLDPLTGLGNRREFDESLAEALTYCSAYRPIALAVIDVDNLKQINDSFGHLMGDQALQTVAEAILSSVRDTDVAARIGGDEFGIILPFGGIRGARRVADRIREALGKGKFTGDGGYHLSVSLGAAESRTPGQAPEELLAQADAELYSGRAHTREPVRPT